ncbi:hypothetical protein ACAG39_09980 [Caldicellulosiruptoraceae bacterium PP1]
MSIKNIVSIHYNMYFRSLKQDKKGFLLLTDKGSYKLMKTSLSPSDIVFIYSAQQHLRDNKFSYFERIIPTKDGCPYIRFENNFYILHSNIEGNPIELNEDNLQKCVDFINLFHSTSTNLKYTSGSKQRIGYGVDRIKSRNIYSVLSKVKNNPEIIKDKEIRSYINENIDKQIQYAKKVIEIFEDSNYLRLIEYAMNESRFIHGNLCTKNILEYNNKLYLKNLFDIEMNIREKDIADFLKSILEKDKNINIDEIIYEFHNKSENYYRRKIILALILMPIEFYSMVKKVMKLEEKWTIKMFQNKIDKIVQNNEIKDIILASLH